ncbi:hypothetical protein GCM10010320_35330 [Streptomyces caelestis]|nr:hypothetical protein GCM10010320_35330 [Streptomyces caelestis]
MDGGGRADHGRLSDRVVQVGHDQHVCPEATHLGTSTFSFIWISFVEAPVRVRIAQVRWTPVQEVAGRDHYLRLRDLAPLRPRWARPEPGRQRPCAFPKSALWPQRVADHAHASEYGTEGRAR